MPSCEGCTYSDRKKTWKEMAVWERKQFHAENEIRVRAGRPKLNKPGMV